MKASEINNQINEDRITRCGYLNFHWCQSGVCISSEYKGRDNFNHTRQKTWRNKLNNEEKQ